MTILVFEPHDSLFFRDGRPFNRGESCAGLTSLFPPSPITLVGAARAAWSRNMGWSGRGPWIKQLKAEQLDRLGGDGQELRGLAFRGPLLLYDKEPLFPAPANLLGKKDKHGNLERILRLIPDRNRHYCDLGPNIHLPAPENGSDARGYKPLSGFWLNKEGIAAVLSGKAPARKQLFTSKALWKNEPRVGITIDHTKGMVEESALYSIQHVRPVDKVTLAMEVHGDLTGFPDDTLVSLGGEARFCRLRKQEEGRFQVPAIDLAQGNEFLRYCVHVFTPLKSDRPPRPGTEFAGLPGRVISGCLPRPQLWGGWDGINRCPLAMRPHLAPGSVLFMEVDTREQLDQAMQLHGRTIGAAKSWGFGLIAIGRW